VKALIAASLALLLKEVTAVFAAFHPAEIVDWIVAVTDEIVLLMPVQMEETVDWIAERTVEMTVLIAFHTVLIWVWMPISSGDRNDTMAFHTVVTAVWIAVNAVEIAVWMAVNYVRTTYDVRKYVRVSRVRERRRVE